MSAVPATFHPLDLRRPGESMRPLPLKLPVDVIARLERAAAMMHTSRAAVARTLLTHGLDAFEDAISAPTTSP